MLRLALAYLVRRPVQILAVFGVAIGLLALLVVLAVMNGLIEEDRASVRGPLADLQLIPATQGSVARWDDYQAALAPVPEIAASAPHLITYALLTTGPDARRLQMSSQSDSNAVQLVGIDPELEALVTPHFGGFLDSLQRSKLAPVEDVANPFAYPGENRRSPGGMLVSERLRLPGGAELGGKIEMVSLPSKLPAVDSGEELVPANGSFRLAGTYRGSDYEMSLDRIYVPRVQNYKGLHSTLVGRSAPDVTEILIRLRDGVGFEAGRAAVLAALAAADLPAPTAENGGAIESWEERRALFLGAIENERRVTTLVMFFIVVVAAFGIFTTLSALVREKVRDLGVLAALGFSPLRRGSFLLIMGAFGSALGAGLGYLGAWLLVREHRAVELFLKDRLGIEIFSSDLYVIQGIPVHWDAQMAWTLTGAAFLVGVLFTLGPAIRAASLSPVEALRYE